MVVKVLVKSLGVISYWKQSFNPTKHSSTSLPKRIITESLTTSLKNQKLWTPKSKDQRTASEGSLYFEILNFNWLDFPVFQSDHSVIDIQFLGGRSVIFLFWLVVLLTMKNASISQLNVLGQKSQDCTRYSF